MKKIILFSIAIILTSCSVFNVLLVGHETDKQLVGTWSGSEKDNQVSGVQKNWIQYRYKDGKYKIIFTVRYSGLSENLSDRYIEYGYWWIKKGVFYEKEKTSTHIDSYLYEITDTNHVIFRARKLGKYFENKNYSFVDSRVDNDSIK
jgi:hypothetical protein